MASKIMLLAVVCFLVSFVLALPGFIALILSRRILASALRTKRCAIVLAAQMAITCFSLLWQGSAEDDYLGIFILFANNAAFGVFWLWFYYRTWLNCQSGGDE